MLVRARPIGVWIHRVEVDDTGNKDRKEKKVFTEHDSKDSSELFQRLTCRLSINYTFISTPNIRTTCRDKLL